MSTITARESRRMPWGRWVGGVAAFAAVWGVLVGCAVMDPPLVSATRSVTTPAEPPSALRVHARNGHVTLKVDDVPQTLVTATIRATTPERLEAITVVAEFAPDGALEVRAVEPAGGWEPNDGVALDIRIPRPAPSAPAAGLAELQTSNGAVEVTGYTGPVRARTSNGGIRVEDAADAHLTTSNGAVDAAGVRGRAVVQTSNGSVTLRLAPSSAGPIDVRTDNGSVTIDVGAAFAGVLSAETSNGRVSFHDGRGRAQLIQSSGDAAEIRFAQEGGPSKVRTSNGSVTIRAAE